MTPAPYRDRSIIYDILSMVPGWLFLLGLDPLMATIVGIPAAAVLVAARVNIFGGTPVRGRIVCGASLPMIGVFVTAALVFGSGGIALGMLLALSLIAVAEGWTRRSGRSFLGRFPLLAGLLFFVLSSIASAVLMEKGVTPYPTEDFAKGFTAPPEGPRWTDRALEEAVALADLALKRRVETADEIDDLCSSRLGGLEDLDEAEAPRGVYVTVFDTKGGTLRGRGRGGGSAARDIVLAVADALSSRGAKRKRGTFDPLPWSGKYRKSFVQIDVPGRPVSVKRRVLPNALHEMFRGADRSLRALDPLGLFLSVAVDVEPGVDGFIIHREGGETATVLPAEPVSQGWLTPRVRSNPRKVRRILERGLASISRDRFDFENEDLRLEKFRTARFGQFAPGSDVVKLYRGNVLFDGDLDRKRLLEAMASGTEWLSKAVRKDGRFHYESRPPHTPSTRGYNLPRHAGAVYGLLAMREVATREPELEEAGRRALRKGVLALDYMSRNLASPDPEAKPEILCFVDEKGRATSGATALGAMALAMLPDSEGVDGKKLGKRIDGFSRDETLARMGGCMLEMIDRRGAVFSKYEEAASKELVDREPLYFPGEVALALLRSYRVLGDEKLLEGARRIADRQLEIFSVPSALDFPWPGDHWIIQALTELSEATGDLDYAELAVLMGRGYVREQYPPQEFLYPDYRGAYRRIVDVPRTTRAASRGEALTAALRAARLTGADPGPFERALVEGARHLIEQQFTAENSYFVPRAWNVEGGFRMGLVDNHLRIDNNQHALVGMIGALEVLSR